MKLGASKKCITRAPKTVLASIVDDSTTWFGSAHHSNHVGRTNRQLAFGRFSVGALGNRRCLTLPIGSFRISSGNGRTANMSDGWVVNPLGLKRPDLISSW